MRRRGSDWPVRKVGKAGSSKRVTLPEQVKGYLELSRGDWMFFGSTKCSCLAGLMKVNQKKRELLNQGRGKEPGVDVRKVQWKKAEASIVIPSSICENMQVEFGDLAVFVPPAQLGIVGMGILRDGRNSTGSRRGC